jgi:hypothetical protein
MGLQISTDLGFFALAAGGTGDHVIAVGEELHR